MKKKRILGVVVVMAFLVCAFSVSAFADGATVHANKCDGKYPYGLYDGKNVTLSNHTDIVVRQSAGGAKWPTNNTLYIGYELKIEHANTQYVNGYWWSEIKPNNNANPKFVNDGFSASCYLN